MEGANLKRLLLGFLVCVCCLATPAAATAGSSPKARAGIGTDIAGAFAGKLAGGGASFLISNFRMELSAAPG